jgi:sulfur carrier protein
MLKGMEIVVNGVGEDLRTSTTVADVVVRHCASPDGIAVARNGDVVPRSAWANTTLGAGDRLEILTAAAGG